MPDPTEAAGVEVDAGPADPAAAGEVRAFEVSGVHVAVAHVDGAWYGFADACTHHDCPLADGDLEGATIGCDCHGSRFDVRSGAVVRGPAREPIATYAATVRAGRVVVQVSREGPYQAETRARRG